MQGMADSNFLIVGGGIAGIASAIGLARARSETMVLERAPAFEETGAGLQLTPNAIRALQWLGAWDYVAPHCITPKAILIRDGHSGKLLQRISLGAEFEHLYGAPYRVALRSDLLSGLLAAAQGKREISLRNGTEVSDVTIVDTTVTLRSGERLRPTALIGADGARSIVRRKLQGHDAPPSSEHIHFRGLLSTDLVPQADRESVTLWLCRGGHLVHYPVSGGRLNVVASMGGNAPDLNPSALNAFPALGDVIQAVKTWSKWPSLAHASDPDWHRNATLLLGDAAHASLPYLAQGAAMALEDACELSLAVGGAPDISTAFAEFTKRRYPRTTRLQAAAERSGRIYHAGGLVRSGRNLFLAVSSRQQFLNRMSWIYRWTPNGIS
jgi:2-polyprenyl-6-methoxyphenol hydroxylase-like FAD-dependent oxidoreductase